MIELGEGFAPEDADIYVDPTGIPGVCLVWLEGPVNKYFLDHPGTYCDYRTQSGLPVISVFSRLLSQGFPVRTTSFWWSELHRIVGRLLCQIRLRSGLPGTCFVSIDQSVSNLCFFFLDCSVSNLSAD